MIKFLKTFFIGLGVLFLGVVILLFIDIKNDDNTPTPTIEVIENSNDDSLARASFEEEVNKIAKDNFGDNFTFTLEDDTYILGVWFDGMVEEVALLKANPNNEELSKEWDNVIETYKKSCKTCKDTLDKFGLYNYHFIVNIHNDHDLDKVLLTIWDGSVIYNIIED